MLPAIVRIALRYRLVVVLVVAGLAAIQIARLPGARYDVFPEFTAPTVLIESATPGFSALQTEQLVTDRLERRLTGLPGLARMRSTSEAGLSVVHLVFHGGTDPYADRQRVAGRLAELGGTLPAGIVPRLAPMQSSTGTALEIGLYPRAGMSLERLTAIAETELRPALLAVPGVATIVIFGARPPQFDVALRPGRLLATGFTAADVARAAHAASAVIGAGFIDTGAQRLVLAPEGQARDAAALAESWLGTRGGLPVSIGDVARVRVGAPPRFGAALIHDRPGLLLLVSSLYGANTLKVANEAGQVVARLTPGLVAQGVGVDPRAFTPAAFIRIALLDLGHVLLIGAGLILLVLLAALRDWRAALISFIAIPVSLLAAVGVITALGITLNTMALAGLAIALGELVDDAVVDVENITRRLRENRARTAPEPRLRLILRASLEVRSAIVFASAAVIAAFTPVIMLGGVAGRLFAPLGIAYIAAIAASLAVALVVTPALAALLLGGSDGRAVRTPPIVLLQPAYRRALAGLERAGGLAAALALAAVIAAAASVPLLQARFLPRFRENDVIVHYLAAPGMSVDAMLAIGRQVVGTIDRLPEVANAVMHIGRASMSNGHAGVNKAEIDITLSRRGNRHAARSAGRILDAVRGIDGLSWWSRTFLSERIEESVSGDTAPVTVAVFGPDLARIDAAARRIATLARKLPGVIAAAPAASAAEPTLAVTLDRAAMLHFGVSARAALEALRLAYAGQIAGHVYRGTLVQPVVVTLPRALRRQPASVGNLPVAAAGGTLVPLRLIATIRQTRSPAQILHQEGRRVQVVAVQTRHGSAAAVIAALRRDLAQVKLGAGVYVDYGGTAVAGGAARRALIADAGIALAVILALIALALRDARAVALVVGILPVAFAGGVATVWIFLRGHLGLGAMVGLATLFGLTLRNGLLLLIHMRRLATEEGLPWSAATARLAAADRLPAIVITAIVTALGLLPLAIASGSPGDAIEGPMAIVILGGLLTATLLSLFVLPVLAPRLARFRPPAEDGLD
ncbi:MAG TPA: efflux RND transporter permease subunit [Acidiphilium sp.]|nr:efflux RND transporter permease subunit [Acidiphilium sp.]